MRLLSRLLPDRGPLRPLALAIGVNTIGGGMFLPIRVLYFTRIVGFTPGQVALGLTAGAVAGLLSGIPIGYLADRRGPREVQIVLLCAIGALSLCYIWVSAVWQYVVLVVAITTLDRGVAAVGGALIAGSAQGADRTQIRAYLRVVMNLGVTAGLALSVIPLAIGTPAAYHAMIVFDGLTYLAAAALYLRLARVPAAARTAAPSPWRALRDLRYVAVIANFSVLGVHAMILSVALPLWIATHTNAPVSTVSALFVINTAVCVFLQVPIARRAHSVRSSATLTRLAGGGLLAVCVLYAFSSGLPVAATVALLAGGTLVHVLCELAITSARFYLTFHLAPEDAQGQYQGLATSGVGLSAMIGPTVIVLLPLGLGAAGWIALGVLLAVAGLTLGPLTARAERAAPAAVEP